MAGSKVTRSGRAPVRKPAATPRSLSAATPSSAATPPRALPPVVQPPFLPEPDATPPAPAAIAAVVETAVSPAPIEIEETPMNDTIKNVAEKVETTAKATFAKFGSDTQTVVEKSKQGMEDYASFQKGNVEALAESARIAAQGFESMGQDAAAFAKKSFDHTSETLKAIASVKSPTELLKLQADYFRSAFDALVAETSRSTEASLKLAGDVAQPLQNRFAIAAEKLKVAA